MNKIITTLFLSSITLFASIDQVQTYYDAKQYEDAIAEAKISTDEYSNPTLHLLWAKSAEALGRENEAMSAYERVEMLDEQNIDARVALVQLYKRTGRDELASVAAKDLQNYQLTPAQRTSLGNLKGTNLHSIKAYASLSVGHDTNVNVAPDSLSNGSSAQVSPLSTFFARFTGSVSYINELEDKGEWYGRADLQVYNQDNFASGSDDFDLFLGSLSGGAGYAGNGYDIYIPIGVDNVHYISSNLLTQIKLKPRVNFTISNELIVNASASYVSRSYNKNDYEARDDKSYGLAGGLYYLLGKNYMYFNASYDSFSANDSSAAKGTYVDKSLLSANLGINYNLASWVVMKADYRFRSAVYADDDSRIDNYHQVEAKFSHYFADKYEAFVSDRYIKNSSNLTTYEYDKNIFMLGVAVNY